MLSNEDPEQLSRLREEYRARFQPVDAIEAAVVEEMVAIRWRQNRLWAHEAALLDSAMDHMAGPIEKKYLTIDTKPVAARQQPATKPLKEACYKRKAES